MKKTWMFTILLVLLLSACRSASPGPEQTATVESSDTPVATSTVTLTPVPPTETPTPTLEATPTATATPEDYGPSDFPLDVNPLTGLKVDEPSNLDRRPVAVKVQTFPRTQRPDWGVSHADIVYDYYQNNGLTRLNAIFYGNNPEKVGPVRSARLFDSHIIRMYEAIFAFGGGDQRILNRLFNSEYADRLVVEGTSSAQALTREDPNGFNFLIAKPEEIGPYVEGKGSDNSRPVLDGTTFTHQPPENGQPGENAYVRYSISSYVHWEYDPVSMKYLRFQDSIEAFTTEEEAYEPFIDRLDEQQVAADNVVVLKVIHEYVYRSGNSEIVDILLGGSGEAYAFRDGKVYQLTWNRPTNALLTLTFPNGTPYTFKPGATWFQVVGQSSTNQLTSDNGLRFEFRLP
jgi:hypothetical protein